MNPWKGLKDLSRIHGPEFENCFSIKRDQVWRRWKDPMAGSPQWQDVEDSFRRIITKHGLGPYLGPALSTITSRVTLGLTLFDLQWRQPYLLYRWQKRPYFSPGDCRKKRFTVCLRMSKGIRLRNGDSKTSVHCWFLPSKKRMSSNCHTDLKCSNAF